MEKKTKDWLIIILLALCIALVGIFLVNQAINYFYKMELLQTPCELCCEKNEGYECPKPATQMPIDFETTGKPILKMPWVEP